MPTSHPDGHAGAADDALGMMMIGVMRFNEVISWGFPWDEITTFIWDESKLLDGMKNWIHITIMG